MQKNYTQYQLIQIILLEVCSRLLVFPWGISPATSVLLLLGSRFPVKTAFIATITATVIFDGIASLAFNQPFFGLWSLFTYSGFIFITALGRLINRDSSLGIIAAYTLFSSLGYWIWSNLGVWLMHDHYPSTLTGLMSCYALALPFLYKALAGDLFWSLIIFGILKSSQLNGNMSNTQMSSTLNEIT